MKLNPTMATLIALASISGTAIGEPHDNNTILSEQTEACADDANSCQDSGSMSCSEAAEKVRHQGYKIISMQCGGAIHEFSTLKGEAVLVRVNARTGEMEELFGGD